jgi:hypothetical protein
MSSRKTIFAFLGVAIFALCILPGAGAATKQPKTYPKEGKVVGVGTNQHAVSGGNNAVINKYSHTYKVETDTEVFELDCGKVPILFGSTGAECGGKVKLEMGAVIHFRVQKSWAYIPITEDDGTPGEQKLRILSEEMKPDAKTADQSQTAQPDTKPQ